jgi:hypothetical protein
MEGAAMALSVKRVQWWAGPIADRAGGLAALLKPLAEAKVNLEFVLARRTPEAPGQGVVFVAPITTGAAEKAAEAAGLKPAPEVAALRVEGENCPGMGYAISRAVADAEISFRGLAAGVIAGRFISYYAFDCAADANRAADVIAAVDPGGPGRKPAIRKKARRKKGRR